MQKFLFSFVCISLFLAASFANEDVVVSQLQDRNTTLGLLAEAQQKNEFGINKYAAASAVLNKESVIRYGHGSDCEASCPAGCCASAQDSYGEAAALALLGGNANEQVGAHQKSAMGACTSFNLLALAENKKDCSKITAMSNFIPQPSWYTDEGSCKPGAPSECFFIDNFVYGGQFKPSASVGRCGDRKDESCGGIKNYFKAVQRNPDGSINIKFNGRSRKISMADLSSPEKLKAIGFSPRAIASMQGVLKTAQQNGTFGGGNSAPYSPPSPSSATAAPAAAALKTDAAPEAEPQSQVSAESLREISSLTKEQLGKKLGGDPIGFSDQNIFIMINKRYQSVFKNEEGIE